MIISSKKLLLITAIILSTLNGCVDIKSPELKLWYTKPANVWEEALPIGNGRIGAMIFGDPKREHLQLNEETVWAGEPGNNIPKGFKDSLPKIRKYVLSGKYKEAEDLIMSVIPRHAPIGNNYGMPYQTLGDLYLEFPDQENAKEYYRELDIQNAISKTSFKINGVTYKREYFVSAPDQLLVLRLYASKKGNITCNLKIDSPHTNKTIKIADSLLVLSGVTSNKDNKVGKVKFETIVKPIIDGGDIHFNEETIKIKNADTLTIFISIGTNFKNYKDLSANPSLKAKSHIKNVLLKPFKKIKQNHIADYRTFFDRVELDLGTTDSVYKPTNERIIDFKSGNDPHLITLYFQYGRYLLISSSRPGGQPANLQGIWNNQLNPPWDSKFTVNINTEMNYWPAEITNLKEMHEPLITMIKQLAKEGEKTAKEMYGVDGWAMHHNTDIWRFTGPVDGGFYGMWPMGGAWLSQHLWYSFLFSGNYQYLKEIYPILEGSAKFYSEVLQYDSDGYLVVTPSMSPENRHPYGTSISLGNTMDNQLVFDVFSNLINASTILNKSSDFINEIHNKRDLLAPMKIGKISQLQEWFEDWDRKDDKHRHVSHLYGLFPSNQISPFHQPKLFQAAKNSLIYRGDKSTGWSMGWKVNLWARLLDGDKAFELIKEQLSPATNEKKGSEGGTYPNLLDSHPPFQIDGNFGCTSGIAEMLIQSYNGSIHLLPALPKELSKGFVKGLRTIGGFTFDLSWENGKIDKLVIYSSLGGNCRLRIKNKIISNEVELEEVTENITNPNFLFQIPKVKNPIVSKEANLSDLELPKTSLFDFETKKGGIYHFSLLK